jgi:hypothetical protein
MARENIVNLNVYPKKKHSGFDLKESKSGQPFEVTLTASTQAPEARNNSRSRTLRTVFPLYD